MDSTAKRLGRKGAQVESGDWPRWSGAGGASWPEATNNPTRLETAGGDVGSCPSSSRQVLASEAGLRILPGFPGFQVPSSPSPCSPQSAICQQPRSGCAVMAASSIQSSAVPPSLRWQLGSWTFGLCLCGALLAVNHFISDLILCTVGLQPPPVVLPSAVSRLILFVLCN